MKQSLVFVMVVLMAMQPLVAGAASKRYGQPEFGADTVVEGAAHVTGSAFEAVDDLLLIAFAIPLFPLYVLNEMITGDHQAKSSHQASYASSRSARSSRTYQSAPRRNVKAGDRVWK